MRPLLILLLTAVAGSASAQSPSRPVTPLESLRQVIQRYNGFVLSMSHDSIADLFTGNGEIAVAGAAPVVGRETIRAHLRSFQGFHVLQSSLSADSTWIRGDSGFQRGDYFQRVVVPSGDTLQVSGGYTATLLRSGSNGWLILRMSTSYKP